jgi:putative transposase
MKNLPEVSVKKDRISRKRLSPGVAKVLKRLHFPVDVILLCVRWYVAYSLSLRNLEEMMAEHGIEVDHSTVHRWVIRLVPLFEKAFRKHQRPVGKSWRMDETYIKVRGQWKYLYRAVDKTGDTVDFLFRARRDRAAAQRYFEKAIDQNGAPETVTVDRSGASLAFRCTRIILSGIELMHMIRKGQMQVQEGTHPSAAAQFYSLVI